MFFSRDTASLRGAVFGDCAFYSCYAMKDSPNCKGAKFGDWAFRECYDMKDAPDWSDAVFGAWSFLGNVYHWAYHNRAQAL